MADRHTSIIRLVAIAVAVAAALVLAVVLAAPLVGCASPPQTDTPSTERDRDRDWERGRERERIIVRDRDASQADSAEETIGTDAAARAAARAALDHAGVDEQDAEGLRVELDTEGGATAYEVTFRVGETGYDYAVDAVTGDVLAFETGADG